MTARKSIAPADADLLTTRRLAAVHLRAGLSVLARAELEMLHARGALDTPALADLAEVRWRAGDHEGAAVAAGAHLAAGGTRPIARVVAAEAAAVAGRPDEAGRHVAALGDLGPAELETMLAGMPQRAPWSSSPLASEPSASGEQSGSGPDTHADADASATTPSDAAAVVERARVDLRGADPEAAAVALIRLALALRLDPMLAASVLAALDRHGEPAAFVVRGDALRILGRRLEAEAAYGAAATAIDRQGRRRTTQPRTAGPK